MHTPDLLEIKRSHFVLWLPLTVNPAPKLILGTFAYGNPPSLEQRRDFELRPCLGFGDLWAISAEECGLNEGQVYHYWFETNDAERPGARIWCTDPTALTVDWRLLADLQDASQGPDDRDPASVILFSAGELCACDPGGETSASAEPIPLARAAANNRIVIYELPTSWSHINPHGDPQVGVGTFQDVLALAVEEESGANFSGVAALAEGRSHFDELGINALELLPLADSFVNREWGYATSNYFAPDFDLGMPVGNSSPTASVDLTRLVNACHERGIRFIIDVVMAFGTRAPLESVNYPLFHVNPSLEPDNPEIQQSGGQGIRTDFGGRLWRYGRFVSAYDPVSGEERSLSPARQYMKAYLLRWMADFGVDGIRMDSVNNVANWDFVQEYKDLARQTWREAGGPEDRFLVVGEELSVPQELIRQGRLDGLWNEHFKHYLRAALLGQNHESESSFEWTVRKLVDARLFGFTDLSQAVIYVGSHDVEGYRNERLCSFLMNNGVADLERRVKLAFVCLLTSVGVPMILAGDEFADQHDLATTHPQKQRDAVNFSRLQEPWRARVFAYVSGLVGLRTQEEALSVNDTEFLHCDFNDGKRVLVWRRGLPGSRSQIVVVANFSDYMTPDPFIGYAEYRVPNWPAAPQGMHWREMTQSRDVPWDWVAREPIFPWEAKVYALVG